MVLCIEWWCGLLNSFALSLSVEMDGWVPLITAAAADSSTCSEPCCLGARVCCTHCLVRRICRCVSVVCWCCLDLGCSCLVIPNAVTFYFCFLGMSSHTPIMCRCTYMCVEFAVVLVHAPGKCNMYAISHIPDAVVVSHARYHISFPASKRI